MSAELVGHLLDTVFSTLDHNFSVIIYVVGFSVSALLSLWRPSRFSLFMLLGFLSLAVGFEYNKHLMEPLLQQTLQAVVRDPNTHIKTAMVISLFLRKLLPVGFYIGGWGFIFIATLVGIKNIIKKV